VTVGADGLPLLITRNDAGFLYPVTLHCNEPLCTGGDEDDNQWASFPAGFHPSVTVGSDGLPVFAHGWAAGTALHITRCSTPDCLAFAGTTKFSTTVAVQYPAIAIGVDGMPVIAFRDATNGDLRVVHCDDVNCSATGAADTDSLVFSGGGNDVGYYTSITIGTDGLPIIAFHDATIQALKVTHCNDIACTGGSEPSETLFTAADDGWYLDMVLSPEGNPLIAHQVSSTSDILFTECNDPACAGGDETTTFVDGTGFVAGNDIAITLSADGEPLIAYSDTTNSRVRIAVSSRRGWSQNTWGN
jgi:hypothetical protein